MNPDPGQIPTPGVVQAVPVDGESEQAPAPGTETITEPAKLLRIASMVRELLDETRQTSLDEPGRKRLAEIYGRSIGELSDVLSDDLREELASLAPPIEGGVPTESELRVAQAQLVGWLEGLFHGIQTTLFAQQMAAQSQLQEMRRRALPPGAGGEQGEDGPTNRFGQYL
jgi:Bacterial proteasome activator